jgi:hypothetical protein
VGARWPGLATAATACWKTLLAFVAEVRFGEGVARVARAGLVSPLDGEALGWTKTLSSVPGTPDGDSLGGLRWEMPSVIAPSRFFSNMAELLENRTLI